MIITIKSSLVISRVFALILTSALLSACSSQTKEAENESKAANYNADLGIEYLRKGRMQLANQKLEKSLEQNPNSAKAHHYFAILQQRLKENGKAQKHFKKAISIDPKSPEIRNNYGSFLCSTSHHSEAVRQFLVAVKDPLYATPEYAYTNAGICSYKANKKEDAEKYFRLALKKRTSFSSALLQMAKLYEDKKDYSRAQAFLLRYEKVGKSTPEALKLCATINKKVGNIAKSNTCTSALLRLFPGSEEAADISSAQ
ncbi:hypothetical protein GQR58_019234 [Nymphon striatum]|nr:hypothetical protein GQR58_019234 [Nymphon striatum]